MVLILNETKILEEKYFRIFANRDVDKKIIDIVMSALSRPYFLIYSSASVRSINLKSLMLQFFSIELDATTSAVPNITSNSGIKRVILKILKNVATNVMRRYGTK